MRVGIGPQIEPKYIGADSYKIAPLFHFKIAHGDKQFGFSAPDDGPSLGIVSSDGFKLGVTGKIQGKRKASDVGAAVGDVKTTYEVGGFAQYEWQDSLRVRAKLLKGLPPGARLGTNANAIVGGLRLWSQPVWQGDEHEASRSNLTGK